ncbi:MAG: HAD hydrolase family protein [Anaerolineae bacterium]|nr:HAD hydrolase family protein [Anaerolineae bacterium]
MYRRILAFDFDGTLAEHDAVPPNLQEMLQQLNLAGCTLFLVTGRRYEAAPLGALRQAFAGIVWENGAVFSRTNTGEVYMPFGYVPPDLISALEDAGVPLEYGLAIVSTWAEHEGKVLEVLRRRGGGASFERNKGAVMLLPPGATKGTGLEKLLEMCGYSPRNVITFGDGENDFALLQIGEAGITVADGVPALRDMADLVTGEPGPAGVYHALERYWINGSPLDIPSRNPRWIPLGQDQEDNPFFMPASELVGRNTGIFGDSGSGKSWIAGLLAEELHLSGYQVLMVDPEGDFRGMNTLSGMLAINGDEHTLPAPNIVVTFLAETPRSIVLDLCGYPVSLRDEYVSSLFRSLYPLREHLVRPHWVVLDEAQHFLSDENTVLTRTILSMMANGGMAFVSYRPDWLAAPIREMIQHTLIARLTNDLAQSAADAMIPGRPALPLGEIQQNFALLDDRHVLNMRTVVRRVRHIRHLYKYLDMPLPPIKRFYFRDSGSYTGQEAASLFEFHRALGSVSESSLEYHLYRGDFARWMRGSLGDEDLATYFEKLARRRLRGWHLREALIRRVSLRYTELRSLG